VPESLHGIPLRVYEVRGDRCMSRCTVRCMSRCTVRCMLRCTTRSAQTAWSLADSAMPH